ncbi:TetR family transcriptional regulator [Dietzia sp. UCD-THP]|uniref:TetR/AcrR family transcriptional regulator n=1 Tax=Dietzia sp. UCD-THP TaxID=1292020 RepID=UPI0003829A7A|nr:hypothetical protein [Dietzia sp. UCD-THP]EYT58775.1 TetR family transcriptional regulator [Dietzia sp. UCD-THP]
MPRSTSLSPRPRSSATREALYQAGLRRFASDGWRTARIRDIVGDAGQGNDSAINYHFGGRMGLLEDVLLRGVLRMEDERRADLQRWASSAPSSAQSAPDLAEIVRAVVSPLADLLDDDEGRCTLRVIAQVGALAEVDRTLTDRPVAGTALQDQLEMLVSAATARCGRDLAGHRVRQLIVMLTAELAARACDPPDAAPPHREYVADLVDWLAGGLARPAPA